MKKLREQLKSRIDEFSSGTLTDSPLDLRDWWGVPDFKGVTTPNVASLMFMVQEGDKTLLLTGDCQQDFIIKGLERTGFLEPGEHVRVNVLKVQHHGSENNMDDAFAERRTRQSRPRGARHRVQLACRRRRPVRVLVQHDREGAGRKSAPTVFPRGREACSRVTQAIQWPTHVAFQRGGRDRPADLTAPAASSRCGGTALRGRASWSRRWCSSG